MGLSSLDVKQFPAAHLFSQHSYMGRCRNAILLTEFGVSTAPFVATGGTVNRYHSEAKTEHRDGTWYVLVPIYRLEDADVRGLGEDARIYGPRLV